MNLTDIVENSEIIPKKKALLTAVTAFLFFSSFNMETASKSSTHKASNLAEVDIEDLPSYSSNLPTEIYQRAEQQKQAYVVGRFNHEEVTDKISDKVHKKILAAEYELAINTLYAGNIHNKGSLALLLNLIKYAPHLFESQQMTQLLAKRSEPLADLVTEIQINAALTNPDNQSVADDELKDEIIAEQKSAIETLQARVSALKVREESLQTELRTLKKNGIQSTVELSLNPTRFDLGNGEHSVLDSQSK